MTLQKLHDLILKTVELLVNKNYLELEHLTLQSEEFLSPTEAKEILKDYNLTLTPPPPDILNKLDIIPITNPPFNTQMWSIRIPLWANGHCSDFTLELTVTETKNVASISIDDLHCL